MQEPLPNKMSKLLPDRLQVYFPDRMPGKMAQFCNAPAERDVWIYAW